MRVWLIYIRKSVVRDGTDLESPERQLYICQTRLQLGETQPYEVEIYQDLDRSGSNEAGREEWLLLKQQLSRPDVVGVVASSLDRLYRNVSEFLAFLNELERLDKSLITAKESLDTSGPLGRFVVTILMALFEMEWRLTSARMIDMIAYKRRNQGRHWGSAPFGSERGNDGQLIPSNRTYILNGETRSYHDALAECFRLYATGFYSYDQLAGLLNGNGWRFWQALKEKTDPKASYISVEWNSERVRSVVGRWRLYRGDLPLGNPVKDRSLEWLPGGHQPILPVELCEAVGAMLDDRNRRIWNRHGASHQVYMLSNVLYCATCGMRLNGQYHHRRFYRHNRAKGACPQPWQPADEIESQVIDAVSELVYHPTLFNDIRRMVSEMNRPDNSAQVKADEISGKLGRLADLYINDGAISKTDYITRRQGLLDELALLNLSRSFEGDDIAGQIMDSLGYLEYAEPKTKKALIETVIKRLEIEDGKIKGMIPQGWANQFFDLCGRWAGWESGTADTPAIIVWYLASQQADLII